MLKKSLQRLGNIAIYEICMLYSPEEQFVPNYVKEFETNKILGF